MKRKVSSLVDEFVQPSSCSDCPFNEQGPGRHLRDSLAPGRMEEIIDDLRARKTFNCHQTTRQTGNGTEKICAGALAFQRKEGCVPDTVQICERIAAIREGRKPRW